MFCACTSLTWLDISGFDNTKNKSVSSMFFACSSLSYIDMRSADFSFVTSYGSMFVGVEYDINVIVKDSDAESFIRARLDENGLTNATVTIANPTSQTGLFEIGPREFGPFYFGGNSLSV